MTQLILLHGAWHNSNCWEPVISLLTPYINTSAPDLVSSFCSYQSYRNIHLHNYVTTLSKLIESIEGDIILAGHSFAGFPISEVASRFSKRISLLIYINAYIPLPSESLYSLTPVLKSHNLNSFLVMDEQNQSISITNQDCLTKYMYNMSSSIPTLRPYEPLFPFQESVTLSPEFFQIPKHAIIGKNDLALQVVDQLYMCERQNVAYTMIDADHCPFHSKPNKLAELILNLRKKYV